MYQPLQSHEFPSLITAGECMKFRALVMFAAATGLSACAVEPAGSSSSGVEYTRTLVHVDANGIVSQQVDWLTETQAAQDFARFNALRSGQAAPVGNAGGLGIENSVLSDSGCSGSDMWAWDYTNGSNGVGNQLCVYADNLPATGLLNNFRRGCCFTWAGAVRSYWVGTQSGSWELSTTQCTHGFAAFDSEVGTADSCTQSANEINFFKVN